MRSIAVLFAFVAFSTPAIAGDMVVIGDSVSTQSRAGGWTIGQGWGAIVARNVGLSEVNLAVPGATVAAMGSQWSTALTRSPLPSCIVVMPGENDINVTPIASFWSTVDSQVASALSAGVPVTIITPFIYQNSGYLSAAAPYLQALRDIGRARGVAVIDSFDLFAELNLTNASAYSAAFLPDVMHPSVIGQTDIAAAFAMPSHADSCAYAPAPAPPTPLIPQMTSDTAPSGTVSANAENGALAGGGGSGCGTSSAYAWNAFDRSNASLWYPGGTTGWIGRSFPAATVVSSYTMTGWASTCSSSSSARAPKNWTFEYWSGSAWVVLDTRSGVTFADGIAQSFIIAAPVSATQYRINISANNGDPSYVAIVEAQMY